MDMEVSPSQKWEDVRDAPSLRNILSENAIYMNIIYIYIYVLGTYYNYIL
jgi:hypothetical protein